MLRAQVGTCHREAHHWRQGLRTELEKLTKDLSARENDVIEQVVSTESAITRSIADTVAAIQESSSRTMLASEASIHTSQKSVDKAVGNLQTSVARGNAKLNRQISQCNRRLERTVRHGLAQLDARMGALIISESKDKPDHFMLAGQNVQELLLPLIMMHSGLIPFLSELLKSGGLFLSKETLKDINSQFEDLLASCHESSAASLRRNHKGKPQRLESSPSSRAASEILHSDSGLRVWPSHDKHDPEVSWKSFPSSRRSKAWVKILPHGLLEVRFWPIRTTEGTEDGDTSNGVYACFTFIPNAKENTKCIAASCFSGFHAAQSPLQFHHIRAFNAIDRRDTIWDVLRNDEVETLKKCLSDRKLTPYDRIQHDNGHSESLLQVGLLKFCLSRVAFTEPNHRL